jgi:hypothetical protein
MTSTRTSQTVYATPGGVNQHDGKLPIRTCDRCGRDIVFPTSRRTGKRYPVTVSRNSMGARFYMGHNLHGRDCGERAEAERAEMRLLDAIHALNTEKSALYRIVQEALRKVNNYADLSDADQDVIDDQIIASWDAIDARFAALAAAANGEEAG